MINFIKNRISRMTSWLVKLPVHNHYNSLKRAGLLEVGRHTYGVPVIDSYRNSERKIIIGSFCSIGPEVRIITGGIHPVDWVSTYPIRDNLHVHIPYDGLPASKGDIHIGHDVWIGTRVTILSGVKIGTGAVIAAGSIVTKDIPPYAIFGGNPAKLIRYRFTKEQTSALLKTKWWEWPDEKIRQEIKLLSAPVIEQFLEKHGR